MSKKNFFKGIQMENKLRIVSAKELLDSIDKLLVRADQYFVLGWIFSHLLENIFHDITLLIEGSKS